MMTPNEIFDIALSEAIIAFPKSNIFKKQQLLDKDWGLSICATPIQIRKGIILGINWGEGGGGESKNEKFINQEIMPSKEDFLKDYNLGDYKFLKKTKELLYKYKNLLLEDAEFNYFNLCFFRSPSSNDLEYEDYKICLPILKEIVQEIKPAWILSLGNSNMNILKPLIPNLKTFETRGTRHLAYSGNLWDYSFYCVPHPNARRLSNNLRAQIWENLFENTIQ